MDQLDTDKKILIVGLGLIGGSYARTLTALHYQVGAIDNNAQSIAYALQNGFIADGTTEVTKEYVERFDLVIFALYPHVLWEWVDKYQSYFKSGALLTDVTGVKGQVVYRLQDMLRPDVEFIGAHPMAGREVYGVENSSATLFHGANYIVTPTAKNTEKAIALCEELGRMMGFRRISRLTPEQHDEMIGFLSQLTHCIAVALMTCKESEHLVDYTGDSFRDLTRIAKINEDMWSELFLLNKAELLAQMDLFLDKFVQIKECLIREDTEKLKEIMRLSTQRRRLFDKPNNP